jgi:hypothetical protein
MAMKLHDLFEMTEQQMATYKQWQRACRTAFPNCTFAGTTYQAQAVDWMSTNNEVAGDWHQGKGVVYKPGTLGRDVLEQID